MSTFKTFIWFIIIAVIQWSCKDDEPIATIDILELSIEGADKVVGDGTSSITAIAKLNSKAAVEKREVIFISNLGQFDNGEKRITKMAERFKGELLAKVQLKMPSSPGELTLTAEVNLEDHIGFYVDEEMLTIDSSIVSSIDVMADSFSVANNFEGEIKIEGRLKNSSGNGVSSGTKVVFEDFDLDKTTALEGVFSADTLLSDGQSTVMTRYTPGLTSDGKYIFIIATVLKTDGTKSGIQDSVKIFIK